VVTPAGAVLIDCGSTFRGALRIGEAIERIDKQPMRRDARKRKSPDESGL
jgi:hypothetical protein